MKVYILDSEYWPNEGIKLQIEGTIESAYKDASAILPKASKFLNIIVQPDKYSCITETGDGGYTLNSELIKIIFDPALPYGVTELLKNIRSTVFHEYNHASRYFTTEYDDSLLNYAVTEGLATVFERDYADVRAPLWGKYEDNKTMQKWLKEIIALGSDWSKKDEYAFKHSDGRRWIIYKTGTWLIDQVMSKNPKITSAQITAMSAQEILRKSQISE